jgi:acetoin utilization deacetylase AcuC-like enzyme
MQVFRPRRATPVEMMRFHAAEYVKFLQTATPDNTVNSVQELERYCLGLDYPVFDDLLSTARSPRAGQFRPLSASILGSATSRSTGRAGCTTRGRRRRAASATSRTASLASWSCLSTIRA